MKVLTHDVSLFTSCLNDLLSLVSMGPEILIEL